MTPNLMDAAVDDASSLAASQRGDVDAFGQLIERYHNLICAIAYSRTGDRVASEDIAQETFFAARKGIRELREPAKLRSWLCGIARNLASKSRRARGPTDDDVGDHEGQLAGDNGPLDAMLTKELETAVWTALEKLPVVYREPLVLFYREDKSVKEVALGLDLTEETAKQRLSRGRQQLRDNMGDLVENTLRAGRSRKAAAVAVLAALVASGAKPAAAATGASQGTGWKILIAALAVGAVAGVAVLGVSTLRTNAARSAASPDRDTAIAQLRRARAANRNPGATCSFDGSIAAADGSPLPGATIAIVENGWDTPSLEPQFVAGPRWKLMLRAGTYTISASASGHRAHAVVVTCAAAQPATVAFTLQPGGTTLRGSIDDAGGGPIATATIWLLDPQRPSEPYVTRSMADGTYEITVDSGQYSELVVHPDYIVEARPVTLGAATTREDVTLVPGGAIEGTVVDPRGAPIVGARVSALAPTQLGDQPVRWQLAAVYGALLPVTTDANGHFALRGLPPGKLRVAARAPTFATISPVTLDLALAETRAGVTVTASPAQSISGFVVERNAERSGIVNAQVFAIREGEPLTMPTRATTDAAGFFGVTGLPAGAYRLVVTAPGFAPSVSEPARSSPACSSRRRPGARAIRWRRCSPPCAPTSMAHFASWASLPATTTSACTTPRASARGRTSPSARSRRAAWRFRRPRRSLWRVAAPRSRAPCSAQISDRSPTRGSKSARAPRIARPRCSQRGRCSVMRRANSRSPACSATSSASRRCRPTAPCTR